MDKRISDLSSFKVFLSLWKKSFVSSFHFGLLNFFQIKNVLIKNKLLKQRKGTSFISLNKDRISVVKIIWAKAIKNIYASPFSVFVSNIEAIK